MNAASSNQVHTSKSDKSQDPWKVHQTSENLFPERHEAVRGRLAEGISRAGIPDLRIVSAEGALSLYSRDQADVPSFMKTAMFDSMPDVVVQPFSVGAVEGVLRYAKTNNLPVIVRGAGSSPFGGSMPVVGGVVLDMNALDRVLELNEANATVKVEAGMRWADLDWYLEKRGLAVRSSPSSRFSTVGGWVATGGIGIGSVSVGRLMESVTIHEIVTGEGETRSMSPGDPMFKPMFGSEGQLAVVADLGVAHRLVEHRAGALADALVDGGGDARALDPQEQQDAGLLSQGLLRLVGGQEGQVGSRIGHLGHHLLQVGRLQRLILAADPRELQ
jgi:hypothetical protein